VGGIGDGVAAGSRGVAGEGAHPTRNMTKRKEIQRGFINIAPYFLFGLPFGSHKLVGRVSPPHFYL
jgi:hypothetical protein